MKKKSTYGLFLLIINAIFLFAGCSNETTGTTNTEQATLSEQHTESEIVEATPIADLNTSQHLVGMIIRDPFADFYSESAVHGFLQTAENLGYPAKVYSLAEGMDAEEAVQAVIDDGGDGVILWAEDEEMMQATKMVHEAGLFVMVPYYPVDDSLADFVDSNLAPNAEENGFDIARILCEEMLRRGKKEGVIAVIGEETSQDWIDSFQKTVEENYPAFTIDFHTGKESQKEIDAYIKKHEDLAGVLALQEGSAKQWKEECVRVQEALQPATTSDAGTASNATKSQAEETTTYKRMPVIIALNVNKENISLVEEERIYAVIVRPFYDSAAQAMAMMDRSLRMIPTQKNVSINVPVVRKNGIEKYNVLRKSIDTWFAGAPVRETEQPKQTATATPSEATKQATPSDAESQATPSDAPKQGTDSSATKSSETETATPSQT